MAFVPNKEKRLGRARKSLLIQPVVIGTHVRVHERACRIQFLGRCVVAIQKLIHGPLALPWRKTHEQRQWLSTAQGFASRPLGKCGAENLRAGTFRKQLELEAYKNRISTI